MKITADQARALSKDFHDAALALGKYRSDNWNTLKQKEHEQIDAEQWSLLNASSDMTTKAVGLSLDEADASFEDIQGATAKGLKALKKVNEIKRALSIAGSLLQLAGAVVAGSPVAVIASIGDLISVVSTD